MPEIKLTTTTATIISIQASRNKYVPELLNLSTGISYE